MPKKTTPLAYEWQTLQLTTDSPETDPINIFRVNADGTWVEYSQDPVTSNFVTTETGKLTNKELKQLDALADQLNQTTRTGNGLVFDQGTDDGQRYDLYQFVVGTANGGIFYDTGQIVQYFVSPDDVQTADALVAMMQTLDARYGDNFV